MFLQFYKRDMANVISKGNRIRWLKRIFFPFAFFSCLTLKYDIHTEELTFHMFIN